MHSINKKILSPTDYNGRRYFLSKALALGVMLGAPAAYAQNFAQKDKVICSDMIGSEPLIWRLPVMQAEKTLLQKGKGKSSVLAELVTHADEALERGPYSVTHKKRLPPSGNLQDYTSLAPYWWPDIKRKDGEPYIRRDGVVNPERESGDLYDRRRLQNMVEDISSTALAGFFTNHRHYSDHAVNLLKVWFVDPKTRKNPNLNYGQSIPGRVDGRDIGIIDSSVYTDVINSMQVLDHMGAMPNELKSQIKLWFKDYTKWLLTSDLGKSERVRKNNHGTYYDLQIVAYALFIGDCALAKRILQDTKLRIDAQITPEGKMPLEQSRTRSLHYYIFNSFAFLKLARMGEHIGEDLYSYKGARGQSILKTLDLLAGYLGREDEWPYENIGGSSSEDLYNLCLFASGAFTSPKLSRALERMSEQYVKHQSQLIY